MKIVIIEDEPRAANRLERLILELQAELNLKVEILAKIASVANAIKWLDDNAAPDLIFMDVRLEDGDSFDILSQRKVDTPIIFCTAYSDYALQAFGANSIDYLLKPVIRDQLAKALRKFQRFSGFRMSSDDWPIFANEKRVSSSTKTYRRQFLIAVAGQFTPVKTTNLLAVRSYLKGTELIDNKGKYWVFDDSLADVENALDPAEFARVSRQWLVRLTSIDSLSRTNQGYMLSLALIDSPIRVSRARVSTLKKRLKV